jgi:hypothetical protein
LARRALFLTLLLTASASRMGFAAEPAEDPRQLFNRGIPLEQQQDPPIPLRGLPAVHEASVITFGPYTSRQVNVNAQGNDIVGDAANEPSLAIDATNHNHMWIGYRQFGNVASNFREAGFAYSNDGGLTWTAGRIQPGVFRSDPVLEPDATGAILYNSLTQDASGITSQIFRSIDNAGNWAPAVFAYGGDKQWMTIDRSFDNVYQAWSVAGNNYLPNNFNKSNDDGASWLTPSTIPLSPIWGTLAAAPNHSVFLAGWATQADTLTGSPAVAVSTDAQIQNSNPPSWVTHTVNLGGALRTGAPNPAGLLGQVWVGVDGSIGPRNGWIYVLSSVQTATDPLDVMFIRSTDQGNTWSTPVRVNDDSPTNHAFQWFGTMSVSPGGRIDAVWNDTRGSADSSVSALYYAYSTNAGATWSANVQVTPTWNCTIGYPNQSKIGDYYVTRSDDAGVDVAYAATFNGGEDVYYLRIPNSATQTGVADGPRAPAARLQSFPNPFTASTTIRFDAPAGGARVRLEVLDVTGHRVGTLIDGVRSGAGQSVVWDGRRSDGSQAAPGVYLCRLHADAVTQTARILRIR